MYQKETSYTVVDLFCGAGGFSLGFQWAGFKNILSIESDPQISQTYRYNFPNHYLLEKDISLVSNQELRQIIGTQKVDVVVGGPPCQGFSLAGNIGRRFLDDSRNMLFLEFIRVVEELKPTCFVMENVARLFSRKKGETREEILAYFRALGYVVEARVLCAADYGVPQNRNRVIFIGRLKSRETVDLIFPEKQDTAPKTIKDAIGHYPPLKSGQRSDIPNHEAMKHSEQMLKKMSYVLDGGQRDSIPINLRPQKGDVRKYIRYDSEKPAICITGDMRKVFHYEQNRALTVRELAAIQSFPDNFVFLGNRSIQQQMVGNAVPPLLALAIAEGIKQMCQ